MYYSNIKGGRFLSAKHVNLLISTDKSFLILKGIVTIESRFFFRFIYIWCLGPKEKGVFEKEF